METISIADIYNTGKIDIQVRVRGWVKTFRSNRFISLNDGSTIKNFQAVIDFEKYEETTIRRITTDRKSVV